MIGLVLEDDAPGSDRLQGSRCGLQPTELSQITGGGIANNLDKECSYFALTPFCLSLIFLGELPQRAIQSPHRNPREF
jgi:hypothetical protein